VRAGPVGDGAPERPAQQPVDLEPGAAGQLLQVVVVQATAAGGNQPENLEPEAVVTVGPWGQDLVEFVLGQLHDLPGVG
jgi:hypothetical protein